MTPSDHVQESFDPVALLAWIDRVADCFEAAWANRAAPDLAPFVAEAAGARRAELLKELVKIDLEHRWRGGERRKAEDYLDVWPELRGPDGWLPDDLVDFAEELRQEFGDTSTPGGTQTGPGAGSGPTCSRTAPVPAVGRADGPGRPGPALRPQRRHRPPRHQAEQHPAGRRGQAVPRRLRPGLAARRRGDPDRRRPVARHPGLHGAGTGGGAAPRRRAAQRRLRPGHRPVRAAYRCPALRRRRRCCGRCCAALSPAAAATPVSRPGITSTCCSSAPPRTTTALPLAISVATSLRRRSWSHSVGKRATATCALSTNSTCPRSNGPRKIKGDRVHFSLL